MWQSVKVKEKEEEGCSVEWCNMAKMHIKMAITCGKLQYISQGLYTDTGMHIVICVGRGGVYPYISDAVAQSRVRIPSGYTAYLSGENFSVLDVRVYVLQFPSLEARDIEKEEDRQREREINTEDRDNGKGRKTDI